MTPVELTKAVTEGGFQVGLLIFLFIFGPKIGAFLREVWVAFREDLKAERQSRTSDAAGISSNLDAVSKELKDQTHELKELRRDIRNQWSGDIEPPKRRT